MVIMGDILSAASLLLTIVTVLYALWYQELTTVIEIDIPQHLEDRPGPLAKVKGVLFSRAIPLFLSSATISIVFVPDAITVFSEFLDRCTQSGATDTCVYSSVKAAICIVVIFSIGITIHSGNMLWKIFNVKKQMEK